jgi:hypothetical protein
MIVGTINSGSYVSKSYMFWIVSKVNIKWRKIQITDDMDLCLQGISMSHENITGIEDRIIFLEDRMTRHTNQ